MDLSQVSFKQTFISPLELGEGAKSKGPFLFGLFSHHMQGAAVPCLSSHWVVIPDLSEANSQSQLSEKMLERETCHPQGFYLLCLSPCLEVSISHLALGLHLPLSLSTQIKKSHTFSVKIPCQAPQDIYCFLNLNCLASYIADVLESWWHVDGT